MGGRRSAHARAVFVLAFVVLLVVPVGVARATVFTVNDTTEDVTDDNPGDGVCEVAVDTNKCTLRAAIQEANSNDNGPDTIMVPAADIQLTIGNSSSVPNENQGATGDLDILSDPSTPAGEQDVTIIGAGADQTTIDGSEVSDRVFDTSDVSNATITNLTITGGNTSADEGADGSGAGIEENGTSLTLDHVAVTDNHADSNPSSVCGGVNEDGGGSLTITNSTISNNSSQFGGGVCENGGGSVDVTDTAITGNSTEQAQTFLADGGGAVESGGGDLTLTRTTISGNSATIGGGVAEDGGGTVTIVDSSISGNHAVPLPPATLLPLTADANSPDSGSGGGVGEDGGGTVDINRTTIDGNDAGRNGGGVYGNGGADVSVTNSTITGNSAVDGGGGIQNLGGDVMTLTSDTFDGNAVSQPQDERQVLPRDAQQGTGANLAICDGPATESGCDGTINVANTIVSRGAPDNCFVSAPPDEGLKSGGNNIDSGTSCGFAQPGDKAATDPKLGQLADNGGPTQTEALLTGSPAIDAGGGCPPPATDQRGITRPQGSACDIGAFEVVQTPKTQPQPPPPQQPAPAIQNAPKGCTDTRRFTFTLHHARGQRVVDVKVFINGTLKLHKRGHNIKKVTIATLPQDKFTVRVAALENTGASLISTRKYDGCGKSTPTTHHHGSRHHHKHHRH